MKKYKKSSDIPLDEIPSNYDFRNIQGYDFTGKHLEQGNCGACYALGFIEAVNSRLKLKYGREVEPLSVQQILSCNFLVEGCDGGWPHLNAFFMEHAYMVSEQCAPYQQTNDKCANYKKCQPKAKILRTEFVGNGFGEVSEV